MMERVGKGLFVILALWLSCSCGGTKSGDTPGELARNFVQSMSEEKFDDCIKMMISCDSASTAYNDNMKILFKQKIAAKKQAGDSLKNVEILQTDGSREQGYANVFLRIVYADSTIENIVIPVVWSHDKWYIR